MPREKIPQHLVPAVDDLKKAIAENLRVLMDASPDEELQTAIGLGARAGVGRKTVNRLLDSSSDHIPRMLSVAAVAQVFGVQAGQLIVRRKNKIEGREVPAAAYSSGFASRNSRRQDRARSKT